ncbi:hypothetical protein Cgig2_020692 [Carnegiea gigantea]|uniref:Uncharacterized protein n=1 Tax=Carnegiea gigantea TaxID=171969 RepID=A0A9Q1GX36_9CARY|nr:hypothetical protein Cgig2_020692 [Carnegiea gigantea]
MPSQSGRKSMSSPHGKNKAIENGGHSEPGRRTLAAQRSFGLTGERTVKRLRLSRALTVPETTTVYDACRRMAARRADALLLTDSNALLCGILTDKDIATRVVARELNLEETPVSKVMTRNPVFVLSDTLAVEALQKMVQELTGTGYASVGKFRHLPVVENGEVVALLDIARCLYDAIARMERAAEKGKAIVAAVEGSNTFMEALRERIFKPSLSTVLSEHSKLLTVSATDTVLMAAKKMLEFRLSCAIVTLENKPKGILTSKDILLRVIAQNLPPDSTPVERVMTPNPECVTVDTSIVDALHTMHDGRFLHLPVLDRGTVRLRSVFLEDDSHFLVFSDYFNLLGTEGHVVAVVDVINLTHAAVVTVSNTGGANSETAINIFQKFWDSAMQLGPTDDDDETRSDGSQKLPSDSGETGRSFPTSSAQPNSFAFKLQDRRGRMHRFICDTRSLTDLITCILQRVGDGIDRNHLPQILYEDEDGDRVVLATDSDLVAAIDHARLAGWKGLRLHLDYSGSRGHRRRASTSMSLDYAHADTRASTYSAVAAGAALAAGLGVLAYMKRNG